MILLEKILDIDTRYVWQMTLPDDGTWEWMKEIAEKDQNVKIHRNAGPDKIRSYNII